VLNCSSPQPKRGSFRCDQCGIYLADTTLPVFHRCQPAAECRVRRKRFKAVARLPFVRTEELISDTLKMIPKLGRIARVVGIARSGMLPASVIATNVGCELWSIDQRSGTLTPLGGGERTKTFVPVPEGKTILIDDSTWTGTAMKQCRPIVEAQFKHVATAVVYSWNNPQCHRVDFAQRPLGVHYFEWNIEHVIWSNRVAWDMDGILCRDFTSNEDDDGERYLEAMRSMEPTKWCFASKPKAIISARLERYRSETAQWLDRHHVPTSSLALGPWVNRQARERSDVASWKADQLKKGRFRVYVESSSVLAQQIAIRTAEIGWPVPVICTEDYRVWEAVQI
jgi:orotate phosphoribosyltransferase